MLQGKTVKYTKNEIEQNPENPDEFTRIGVFLGWGIEWEENNDGTAGLHYSVAIVQDKKEGIVMTLSPAQISFPEFYH